MRRILIIEDDHDLRQELVELIESFGAIALSAASSEESLAAFDATVDVILCDYKLKAETGLDVVKCLRSHAGWRNPTVYLMTGHLDLTEAARREIAMLTEGLFMKPIRAKDLRGMISGG